MCEPFPTMSADFPGKGVFGEEDLSASNVTLASGSPLELTWF